MLATIICSNDVESWRLGCPMQRLAEDSNPVIAAAASKTIYELKKQWEIEEGDSWRFMMNPNTIEEGSQEANDNTDTNWEAFWLACCKYSHESMISHTYTHLITRKVSYVYLITWSDIFFSNVHFR